MSAQEVQHAIVFPVLAQLLVGGKAVVEHELKGRDQMS
jgi:hypothetical protein